VRKGEDVGGGSRKGRKEVRGRGRESRVQEGGRGREGGFVLGRGLTITLWNMRPGYLTKFSFFLKKLQQY
jgi:hypothetical protein